MSVADDILDVVVSEATTAAVAADDLEGTRAHRMSALRLFTSESVTEGHPDKICDQISDSILDALLTVDPHSRVAVETLVTTGLVHVAGEVTTSGYVEIPAIVRERDHRRSATTPPTSGSTAARAASRSRSAASRPTSRRASTTRSRRASARATTRSTVQGAGDQGIMFGYATRETPELMPLPIWLAHRLAERLAEVRKQGELDYLRPDGKTQVTVGYDGQVPRTIETVVLSTQHSPAVSTEQLRAEVEELVIRPVLDTVELARARARRAHQPHRSIRDRRPAGRRRPHRPQDHRRHLRRREPSRRRRVQRQGPVEGRPLRRVRHALGREERRRGRPRRPARAAGRLRDRQGRPGRALRRDASAPAHVPDERIIGAIREVFDLRPAAIIRDLDLLRPIYAKTASYGHFGRELPDFTWERLDRVDDLRAAAGL